MLSVENLGLYKNDKKIFTGVGFSLFVGSSLVVAGKNGSGKTSMLKILAGISKESSGKILWDNQNIEDFRSDFNGDLQFIGHKNFLKQELTVYENLSFYAALNDCEDLIPAALAFFKLGDFVNEKVKNLSAGWQKKVMLAKLMVCPATIWILDEPTVHLDFEAKNLLKGLIKTKLENQGVVIISTHEVELFDFSAKISMEDFS